MGKYKTAFIDLDGTVVDVFKRYYGILSEYLKKNTNELLDFVMYKNLKRQGLKDHVIVKNLIQGVDIDVNDYVKFKRSLLEDFFWLKKDFIIGEPQRANFKLKSMGYKTVLLTQRNNKINLIRQLEFLGIQSDFDEIVMVSPVKGVNVKTNFVKTCYGLNDIIIGDSYVEIEVSKTLNIKGYFVESGLFSAETLGVNNLVFEDYEAVVDFILQEKV